jgi:general secretion pathway protein M
MSPRERTMVTLAAFSVAAFVLFMLSMSVARSVGAREQRIDEKTRLLSQIGKLTQGYRAQEAERKALETKLNGPPLQLISYVSQTGTRVGVEVNDLRPATPGGDDKVVEDSVEVNLARIDLPKLARLLEELERGPGIVKVRRLRLSTRNDDPELVDATLLIATYRLKSAS